MVRTPSPPRRRRSKSRERERDRNERERDRRRRRSRSRDRDRRRRSPERERDHDRRRDDRRRSRSWSKSRSRSRSNDRNKNKSRNALPNRPPVTDADLEGKTQEEQEMLKMMGFCNFDTSKGKKIESNEEGAVHVILKRKYRQYMNRKGGFNRPLDFVA